MAGVVAVLLPWLFFDPERSRQRGRKLKSIVDEASEPERRLFCAACKHVITHQDERIHVQGGHQHRFTNPHGITYEIGCFRHASGCSTIGEATSEFTWFRGYAWRIAVCGNCQTHLGWHFQSTEDDFHGLIVDRLSSAGPTN